MPPHRPHLTAFTLACLLAGAARADLDADVSTLKGNGVDTAGPALLAFFKKRTPTPEVLKKIEAHIKALGDEEHDVREKATQALVDIGAPARGKLTEALKSPDAEVKSRARRALQKIRPVKEAAVVLPAAARVLADRKPAGAVEVLLAFLPHLEDPLVADEVAAALGPLALGKDRKPDPLLLKALSSTTPRVRAAAAQALASAAGSREAARKLLADPSAGVRRRVAVALLHARDKASLPVLVALTGAAEEEDASAAEDALVLLAGEKSPAVPSRDDPKASEKTRAGWEKWWKEAGPGLDLASADLGASSIQAVMGVQDKVTREVKLLLLNARGQVKHAITPAHEPNHAVLSGPDRLVVAEARGRFVEMDFKGKVHWSRSLVNISGVHRSRNGNVLGVGMHRVILLDRNQKEIVRISRADGDIACAGIRDDGTIDMLVRSGRLVRYDSRGNQTANISLGGLGRDRVSFLLAGLHAHYDRDGSIIVPEHAPHRVRCFDRTGKQRWSVNVPESPWSVTMLRGGGVAYTTMTFGPPFDRFLYHISRDRKKVTKQTEPGGWALFISHR